jgi:16S rRNA (guanine527-N7)-methyltransferase
MLPVSADKPVPRLPLPPQSGSRLRVEQALAVLGLSPSVAQIDSLLAYLDLISKWTRVYNLTAVRDPAEMVTHHLLDCLAAMAPLAAHFEQVRRLVGLSDSVSEAPLHPAPTPSLKAETGEHLRLLDVGSGAGLPGVVIAICFPDVSVTCVDTVAKKAAFIKQVALTLKLPNLTGLHARVEALTAPTCQPFDVICSRAFASLADFTHWSVGALSPSGVWMAMKGKHPADEIAALPGTVEVFHVEQLKVPELDAERCIVWMRKRTGPAD